ncbi:hypothetical protein [Paractinoplanes durhamensis]|uniref:Uncharacterized protein n=1 Tax=Paractinoplanes durhamensis TaxID=113563 RepID=A0ABQ3Z3Z4_9ACTN|nr:hypothetical protein [Actinoplanes durhamensis]GIE04539.1 hypothetical protein Adu01nite_58890 [Actinoplanes durhamensis]
MFPLSDPTLRLDLHHQRVAEMIRAADQHTLARSAEPAGRHRRFGRWRRPARHGGVSRVTATI